MRRLESWACFARVALLTCAAAALFSAGMATEVASAEPIPGTIVTVTSDATPALAPRANPIPPPSDGCLIGAFVGGPDTLAQFDANAGKQHAMFLEFFAVGQYGFNSGPSSASSFCSQCYSLSAVPYLTIEPWNATSSSLLTTSDVTWVEQFASDVGALDRPVFIRFGHEMNGDWYPWGWTNVTPDAYVRGFRQVAAIFRERAPKAAMVWAPSQNWGDSCDHVYSNWYPGDEYVDWVGLTSYQWSYSGLSPHQFYYSIESGETDDGPGFYDLFAVGHDKPMMVAETACRDDDPDYYDSADKIATYGTAVGQGAQNWWIPQVYSTGLDPFSVATAFPRIHAITWFDSEDFGPGGTDLTQHSTGFGTYATAISGAYWRSDALPPTTSAAPVLDGWVNHDVAITVQATDGPNGSGVAHSYLCLRGASAVPTQTYTGPVTVSADGTTAVSYWSVDSAGNVEPASTLSVAIDKTPPQVTGSPTTEANAAGWYRAPVVVRFTAIDALSGVSAVSPQATLGSEGASQSVTGSATDNVGNTASVTVNDVNIDLSPPTTTDDHVATYSAAATIRLIATDTVSGVARTEWALDGVPGSGDVVTSKVIGTHTLTYDSTDFADNPEETHHATFQIVPLAPQRTALSVPHVTGAFTGRNARLTFTAYVSPHAAATDATSTLSLSHYEYVWRRITVKGTLKRARFGVWKLRSTVRLTGSASGRLLALARLSRSGRWRAYVSLSGNLDYLPSKSGRREIHVK